MCPKMFLNFSTFSGGAFVHRGSRSKAAATLAPRFDRHVPFSLGSYLLPVVQPARRATANMGASFIVLPNYFIIPKEFGLKVIIAHEHGTDSWFFWHPLEGVGLASWEVKRAVQVLGDLRKWIKAYRGFGPAAALARKRRLF